MQVTDALGRIGTHQSRLNTAHSNIQSLITNYKAAESRIADADIAQESASYIRQTIIQQIGASVLNQANHLPDLALKLLQ